MVRELIVTADDVGADVATNEAVERCVAAGIVTQVSVMGNGGALADAARRFAGVPAGVHLNLTEGVALRGRVPGATDRAGRFLGLSRVLAAALLRRVDAAAAEGEWAAQIDAVRAAGLVPTYADGHQHVHVFPGLLRKALGLARDRALRAVRVPAESPLSPHRGARCKRALLAALAAGAADLAARHGLRTPEHFRGLSLYGRTADHLSELLRLLSALPEGRTELMVHPRGGAEGLAELRSLTHPDVRAALERAQVRLIAARDL